MATIIVLVVTDYIVIRSQKVRAFKNYKERFLNSSTSRIIYKYINKYVYINICVCVFVCVSVDTVVVACKCCGIGGISIIINIYS